MNAATHFIRLTALFLATASLSFAALVPANQNLTPGFAISGTNAGDAGDLRDPWSPRCCKK